MFHISDLRTVTQLNEFYRILTDIVSDPLDGVNQHRRMNVDRMTLRRYLAYVQLTDGNDQLTLMLRSHDNYVVGY